eukprot:14815194-Heterocapsa_arctica.AAC.1
MGVVRAPQDTRPLGLKNSDVKAISGAAHAAVKFDLRKSASLRQNGFIAGRTFLNKVIDLDTASRIAAMDTDHAM